MDEEGGERGEERKKGEEEGGRGRKPRTKKNGIIERRRKGKGIIVGII